MAMKISVDGMTFGQVSSITKALEHYPTKLTNLAGSTYIEFEVHGARRPTPKPTPDEPKSALFGLLGKIEAISF